MDITDKIVLAHKGFFNAECTKLYRENSVDACRASGVKDYVHIIELDVRKSSDGILYCYHGTLFEYHLLLKFPQTFSAIKSRYGADSLEDILNVIEKDKIIFLDIKDTNITAEDVLSAFQGKLFKEIILGNRSMSYLDRFNRLPDKFVKILNGNMFCNFYNLRKLKEKKFAYFEVVFPFQVNRKIINAVQAHGMEFRCAGLFFLSRKSYWKKIRRYGIRHISSDFI